MTLVEFLLARIAEDESLAAAANVDRWGKPYEARSWMGFVSDVLNSMRDTHEAQDEYIYRFEPSRVLAECQAKRAIIEYHRAIDMALTDYGADQVAEGTGQFQECLEDGGEYPCPTLRHLAAVYADHPDYDPAWRP